MGTVDDCSHLPSPGGKVDSKLATLDDFEDG